MSTEYIEVKPAPAVITAYHCTEALKREGIRFEFEGSALAAIAQTLMGLERSGAIIFTDEEKPGYETSRPATSMESSLAECLRSLIAGLANLSIEDAPFWESCEDPDRAQARDEVRQCIADAEKALGF